MIRATGTWVLCLLTVQHDERYIQDEMLRIVSLVSQFGSLLRYYFSLCQFNVSRYGTYLLATFNVDRTLQVFKTSGSEYLPDVFSPLIIAALFEIVSFIILNQVIVVITKHATVFRFLWAFRTTFSLQLFQQPFQVDNTKFGSSVSTLTFCACSTSRYRYFFCF